MKQKKSKIKYFTKKPANKSMENGWVALKEVGKERFLDNKREFLLLLIVKLKELNRKGKIELEKQNNYLNNLANEIVVSDEERLELFSVKLNEMFKDE